MLSLIVVDCESKSVKRRWELNTGNQIVHVVVYKEFNFVVHFNLYREFPCKGLAAMLEV